MNVIKSDHLYHEALNKFVTVMGEGDAEVTRRHLTEMREFVSRYDYPHRFLEFVLTSIDETDMAYTVYNLAVKEYKRSIEKGIPSKYAMSRGVRHRLEAMRRADKAMPNDDMLFIICLPQFIYVSPVFRFSDFAILEPFDNGRNPAWITW